MSDEYKALSKEWPIDELNALRARVKELEAQVKCLEASTRFSAEDFPRVLCNHTAHQIALTEEMAGRVKELEEKLAVAESNEAALEEKLELARRWHPTLAKILGE